MKKNKHGKISRTSKLTKFFIVPKVANFRNSQKNMWKIAFGFFVVLLLIPQAFAFSASDVLNAENLKSETVGCVVSEPNPQTVDCTFPITEPQPSTTQYPMPPYQAPKIDVVFVVDSTGSMADEIRSVKMHLVNLINDVRNGQPSPDLRVGIATYRDFAPQEYEYGVKQFDLNQNIDKALDFIRNIHAAGGGDYPEAVATGLDTGINHMSWRYDAKKLIFLIGDAPPHGEGSSDTSFHQGTPDGKTYEQNIRDAVNQGIRIYTISGSGMDHIGLKIWKQIAHKTGGQFEQLDYYRVAVEQYVEDNQLSAAWVEEVQEYADYDKKSKSFLANTFGSFAKGAMMQEAESMGVSYDNTVEIDSDKGSVLTANTIVDVDSGSDTDSDFEKYETEVSENRFLVFMKSVLNRMIFWT